MLMANNITSRRMKMTCENGRENNRKVAMKMQFVMNCLRWDITFNSVINELFTKLKC